MVSMCTVSSVSAYDTNMSDSQAQIQQQNSGDSVYGDFQYTVSDSKVTITNYTGSATAVSIPSKIEGKSVTSIGYEAFYHCDSLTSVTIPNSVTSIGYDAFYHCISLTNVTIPNSVISIGNGAFCNCSNLTNIDVNSNNANYSSTDGILFNKNKTELVCYPAGKTNTSYTIPNSVTSIGEDAFSECSSLTSVEIPNSVTRIGDYAFSCCSSLTSVEIPNSVTSIGDCAFSWCSSLTSVTIPNSVTSIGDYAFSECSSLTSVEIPNSVTSIGDCAFSWCSSLTSVEIPNSVTRIGDYAFSRCSSLTSVTIPNGVMVIEECAFANCENMKDVYYSGTQEEWKKIYVGLYNDCLTNAIIHFNYTGGEQNNDPSKILEDELLYKTKLYTSDGGNVYKKVLEGLNERLSRNDISTEDKMNMLNSFYKLFNITDIQEGTAYCLDAMNGKRAYDFLTNDKNFLAYQFKDYLQNTALGTVARGLMITDGWIFNNELKQWIDPKTYITQETEDIKNYKAMLLSFMNYEAETGIAGDVSEVIGYADNIRTHIEYFAESLDEAAKKNIKKDLAVIRATSSTMTATQVRQEMKKIWNKYNLTGTMKNGKKVYHVKGFTELSKALKISGNVFQISVTSIDDIMDIISVESKLETIEKYRKFLELIANGKDYLPGDMVIAANQLLNETVTPYLKQFIAFIYDEAVCVSNVFDVSETLKNKLTDKLKDKYPKLFKGKPAEFISTFGDAVAVIKISAVVTDAITNVGTTIKDAAYVEAYAYLGQYFSNILKREKDKFNTNQSVENAWNFYDIYNLLFRIRACGENSYLKMCDDSPVTWILSSVGFKFFDITDRKKYVEDTFEYMNEYCFFGLENADQIPESHKFAQKAIIKCPVNVEIYDDSGELVYKIFDSKEIDDTNTLGRFICKYDPKLGEYIKIICLNNPNRYTIKSIGVDSGNVSIETTVVNAENTVTSGKISGLPIDKNGIITLNVQTGDYTDDKNGDGSNEYTGKLQKTDISKIIPVNSIKLSDTAIELKVGEKKVVGVTIEPVNATFTDVVWESSDETVAVVKNGAIKGISTGEAKITVFISGRQFIDICKVKVIEPVVEVESISLNKTALSMNTGSTANLMATITPTNATDKTVTWKSSNTSVATVSNGKVTAKSVGTTMITVQTSNGKTATCKVTVIEPVIEVESISLNKTALSMNTGSTANLTATIIPTNATDKTVTWKSSNTSVATISNGKVTAKSVGTATITAKTSNGKTATCKIIVEKSTDKSRLIIDEIPVADESDFYFYDYDGSGVIVTWYYGNASKVHIPDTLDGKPVVAISSEVFKENKNITHIILPDSLLYAASEAFCDCINLRQIYLGSLKSGLDHHGLSWLLKGCTNLEVLSMSDKANFSLSYDRFGSYGDNCVFYNETRDSLKKIYIGNSMQNVAIELFYGDNLEWVEIGNNNKYYSSDNGVVYSSDKKTLMVCGTSYSKSNYVIPSGTQTILNSYAFDCKNLKSLTIPDSMKNITSSAFQNCSSLTSINSDTNSTIYSSLDGVLFNKNKTKLICYPVGKTSKSYTIPSSVTSVGSYAFANNHDLESITTPNSLASIGEKAFGYYYDGEYKKIDGFTIKGYKGSTAETYANNNGFKFVDISTISITGVTLNKTEVQIQIGNTEVLIVTITPSNATDKIVNWKSSNTNIATVSNGKVTAKSVGTAVITAKTSNGKTATCKITVVEEPTSISINKSSLIVGVGETFKFSCKTNTETMAKVIYTSSKTAVATVDSDGNMKAKSAGTAIITAKTDNGKIAKCRVTVKNAPTKISINRANSIMGLGETFYLEGSLANDEASRVLTFSSNKPEVATVTDGGIVTAKSIGTAIVSITTYNGQKATCRVTVRNAPQNVYFNKTEITLGEGQTFYLESQFNTNEYARTVVYNSKNKSIATISGSGVIMAKSVGTATITGKTYNGKTATCIVTVKKAPTSVKLNKSSLNMKVGQTETLKTTLSTSSSATGYVWKSSDKSIVTVNSDGTMVAKKVGTATITVKTHNGKTADCIVTVKT